MSPLRTEDLACLLELMRSMQHCVVATNWKELELLDKKRRELLQYEPSLGADRRRNFSESINATETPKQQDSGIFKDKAKRDSLISEIRSLDAQIIQAVQASRQRLLDENRDLSDQQKAKNLYAKTSSMT